MVKRYFFIAFFALFFTLPTATLANCNCTRLQETFAEYLTVDVSRYQGGLTPRAEAISHIDAKVIVSEDVFILWDEARYDTPHYEVICHRVPQEEGEVPLASERWGNFYGFGIDRDVIELLYVASSRGEGPQYRFEIVGDELWAFLDGWFYRMERISHD